MLIVGEQNRLLCYANSHVMWIFRKILNFETVVHRVTQVIVYRAFVQSCKLP